MQIRQKVTGCRPLFLEQVWARILKNSVQRNTLIIKAFRDMKIDHPKSNADNDLARPMK